MDPPVKPADDERLDPPVKPADDRKEDDIVCQLMTDYVGLLMDLSC